MTKLQAFFQNHGWGTHTLDAGEYKSTVTNDAYQAITLSTDQQVSQEFYTWFTANANKEYPLEAGTYKWKDSPTLSVFQGDTSDEIPLSFVSNNQSFNSIILYWSNTFNNIAIEYLTTDDSIRVCQTGSTWAEISNIAYQTVTLDTAQTVSADFYKWAITDGNLVKQATG